MFLMACNVGIIGAPLVVGCNGTWLFGLSEFQKFAHVLYSTIVIGWATAGVPAVSLVNSVGKVPIPNGVLPVLL